MNPQQSRELKQRAIAVLATTLLLAGGSIAMSFLERSAIAQSFPATLQGGFRFPTGRDQGAPERTVGSGVRGQECRSDRSTPPLTALVPINNVVRTVAGNPSIYAYVPTYKHKVAIFHIINPETEEILYETEVELSDFPGTMELSVPETIQLESNITYQWGLYVQCDPNNPLADEGIEGWIERVELTPEREVAIQQTAENSLERAQLYAEAEVWHETLAIAARLRDSEPTIWAELLESVGLSREIADSPAIESRTMAERQSF